MVNAVVFCAVHAAEHFTVVPRLRCNLHCCQLMLLLVASHILSKNVCRTLAQHLPMPTAAAKHTTQVYTLLQVTLLLIATTD